MRHSTSRVRWHIASLVALVALGSAGPVSSQEVGPARASGVLDELAGEWEITWSYITAGGRAYREGEMHSRWTFGGWMLQDELVERRADGSEIRTVIQRSLDPATGVWQVLSWELPHDERPYILDGEVGDDGIMRGAGGPVDSTVRIRYTLESAEDRFTLSMDLSRDEGATWIEGAQVIEGRRQRP